MNRDRTMNEDSNDIMVDEEKGMKHLQQVNSRTLRRTKTNLRREN